MSMDDFGFFSEASDSAATAASSYSSGSRPSNRHDYHQYAESYQARGVPLMQQHYHDDYQRQAHYQQQQQQQQQQQHPHRLTNSQASGDIAALTGSNCGANAAGQSTATPAKRGSNLACLKCRAIKVKCWKSNPNDPRCARCNRLDLFCEFREHHRGKKLEKVIADENRNVVLSPNMLRRARLNMLRCSSYPLNLDMASVAITDNAEDAAQLAMPSNNMSASYSGSFAAQTYGVTGLASSSLPSPVGMASSAYDDVVRMNACSWTDACYLFSLFSTQLNPIVALLEPGLHTVQYTREQSPILFSTILGISSRFFRPDLHLQCQTAAASILKFASARQLCSIDHIQALIVSAIWALPGDATRSETLSAAIAYAYELGLPFCFEAGVAVSSATKPYTPPLPIHLLHGGHQTTMLRMQQRTWIQLCLLELSQQSDSRRTSMQKRPELIAQADFPNVRVWYELNNSTMSAYDTRLAYQLDFALSQRSFNRLATSAQTEESELSRSIEALMMQERDCFSTWYNMYGDEYVARYGMDRYSNAEAGYFLLLYRFARAVQLHTTAAAAARQSSQCGNVQSFGGVSNTPSQLEERWFTAATELAFKVLQTFSTKILDQDATSSSMLRFSPQYMASGCLTAARWLLPIESQDQQRAIRHHLSTTERARERVSKVIRLLAQPQFYPDGNRVPTTNEITGQLDQALRSLVGDGAVLISPSSGTSPKRARETQDQSNTYTSYQMGSQSRSTGSGSQDWSDGQNRKQRRRTSNGSLVRVELGSVGGRSAGALSESAGSERGGSEWSPHLTGDRWTSGGGMGGSSGYVSGSEDTASISIEASLGEPHWPPSLLGMSVTAANAAAAAAASSVAAGSGPWTPTSEGALSNMAMASSISPPASASSAVFSVSASALPDHLDLGLDHVSSGAYSYTQPPSSSSTPSLPLAAGPSTMLPSHPDHTQGTRSYPATQLLNSTHSYPSDALSGMFGNEAVLPSGQVVASSANHHGPYPLARNETATQQSYSNNDHSSADTQHPFAPSSLNSTSNLDASLTVGLSTSYDDGSTSSGFLNGQRQQ
ncbi:uncharacterized protein UTRI_03081_B [Ustilago trichophora]|uniref:Zn(2)-C6 fungal-type domain-containing protein n=1 Tax=Ustilago trichophora TaxID=86804 RepID=A0A5C3E7A9_9BASI|nr:uncharacterized protein UTRI_03081_B [Ustilago trichophora]